MMPSVNVVIYNGDDMGFGFMEERDIFDMCRKHARTKGCRVEGREMRTVVAQSDGRYTSAKFAEQLADRFQDVTQNHADNVIADSDWDGENEEDAPTEDEDGDLLGVFNPSSVAAFVFGSAEYGVRIEEFFGDVEYEVTVFKFDTTTRKWID